MPEAMGDEVIDNAQALAGPMAEPDERAPSMVFLAHPNASSYITDVKPDIDNGTGAARAAGTYK